MKKLASLLLALVMIFSLVACGGNTDGNTTDGNNNSNSSNTGNSSNDANTGDGEGDSLEWVAPERWENLAGKEWGVDYTDLYHQFSDVTIDEVVEDEATGLAYLERDGEEYELGLDFLTWAMVYNTSVPEGGRWQTEDDVYATWWKYYIQRWNILLPEVPLYSNEYYDIYNAQIKGVEENPTNPFWGADSAFIDWSSEKEDNSIILGSSTELSGRFRSPAYGVSSPGASDNAVGRMLSGLETVSTVTKDGSYQYNQTVVVDHSEVDNADGSRTYTIQIADDLQFSDGSPVLAKHYLNYLMMNSTPVSAQAGGSGNSGINYVGFEEFRAYDGTEGSGSKEFSGIRILDDYTFSVTVDPDYLPYYYAISYASFNPTDTALWLGDSDLADDGNGVYITGNFYAKNGDSYVMADHITASVWDHSQDYAVAGPYMIESWDEADHSVVLVKNPNFKGNYEGTVPAIEKVVYKRIISETQLADFQAGGVDVLSGVTGGAATDEAIALVNANPDKYVATHYSRAGYGKLGFRADLGPAQFTEVREAIAYCMDRATFAKDFTGGYGGVVDGPYYTFGWMYKAAVADGMLLNAYDTSVDSAIAVLEKGGWNYNADGTMYTGEGVRYKAIPEDLMYESDITYASVDGAYTVTHVDGYYYMPLVLNWYGTADNEFTDLLVTGFMNNDNIKAAGFAVYQTIGDFNPMLDELTQGGYGVSYSGTPTYNCFNFATGFGSAVYDYSWNMTIDPELYDIYSSYYIKDQADVFWLK